MGSKYLKEPCPQVYHLQSGSVSDNAAEKKQKLKGNSQRRTLLTAVIFKKILHRVKPYSRSNLQCGWLCQTVETPCQLQLTKRSSSWLTIAPVGVHVLTRDDSIYNIHVRPDGIRFMSCGAFLTRLRPWSSSNGVESEQAAMLATPSHVCIHRADVQSLLLVWFIFFCRLFALLTSSNAL